MKSDIIYRTLDDFLQWYSICDIGMNVCGYTISYDYDKSETDRENHKIIAVILVMRRPLHKIEKYLILQDWIKPNVDYLKEYLQSHSNLPKPRVWNS